MEIYLIDGTSFIYRAYHAVRGLKTSQGFPTGALYGFTGALLKIAADKSPQGMAVVFDSPQPTHRHLLYPQYKANRTKPDEDMIVQIAPIRQIVEAFNIPALAMPGYEADDILATLAQRLAGQGTKVFIVTSDKDLLQVVGPGIAIYDPMKNEYRGTEYVEDRYSLAPGRIPELLALAGDSSDNIPGVRGIGEKTAIQLLCQYPSLDELLAHPERIEKERFRTMITASRDIILLSRDLATVDTKVPLNLDKEALLRIEPDWPRLKELFQLYEFTSYLKLVPAQASGRIDYTLETPACGQELATTLAQMGKAGDEVALRCKVTGGGVRDGVLEGIVLALSPGRVCLVDTGTSVNVPQWQGDAIVPFLEGEGVAKAGHDLKEDIHALRLRSIELGGSLYDTMVASYLLNPNRPEHSLESCCLEYLGVPLNQAPVKAKGRQGSLLDRGEGHSTQVAQEAAAVAALRVELFGRLKRQGLMDLYTKLEMPLIRVLANMERHGIRMDTGRLKALSNELAREIGEITGRIHAYAGGPFNINSPKQLQEVLFDKLMLPPGRKIKSGYSTDTSVLEPLTGAHPIIEEILRHRTLAKLKNTYLDTLPGFIDSRTGRIHTTLNQAVAATGRLSSSAPNLQNIPVKGEWGEKVRSAFIADPGNVLLAADYSQIELRVLAHLSRDANLMDAFLHGEDIHGAAAGAVFGTPLAEVTPDMRRVAKTINFGIIYGMSPFGLAEVLKIGQFDAKRYIDRFFARFRGVEEFMTATVEEAGRLGYTTTIMGRVRPIADLMASNRNVRQQAERLAINSPVQGSAADIIKAAMIETDKAIARQGLRTRMILQIHDELLFETPQEELEEARAVIKTAMEHAVDLAVPLVVDVGHGRSWGEIRK